MFIKGLNMFITHLQVRQAKRHFAKVKQEEKQHEEPKK